MIRILAPFAPFETQYELVLDGKLIRLDIAWPWWRVAAEVDGWGVRGRSRTKFDGRPPSHESSGGERLAGRPSHVGDGRPATCFGTWVAYCRSDYRATERGCDAASGPGGRAAGRDAGPGDRSCAGGRRALAVRGWAVGTLLDGGRPGSGCGAGFHPVRAWPSAVPGPRSGGSLSCWAAPSGWAHFHPGSCGGLARRGSGGGGRAGTGWTAPGGRRAPVRVGAVSPGSAARPPGVALAGLPALARPAGR